MTPSWRTASDRSSALCSDCATLSRRAVGETLQHEQLRFLVALRGRIDLSAAHLDFERLRVADVAALRIVLQNHVERFDGFGTLTELVLRVRLPVQRRIRLRPLH